MTVASLALLAWNRDDERAGSGWRRDRWGFWHFWLGDTHMGAEAVRGRLAVLDVAEAAAQSLMGDDRRFWGGYPGMACRTRCAWTGHRIIAPALEVGVNGDSFTAAGREPADQGQGFEPALLVAHVGPRRAPRTGGSVRRPAVRRIRLSPKGCRLFEGYFGEVRRWALDTSDALNARGRMRRHVDMRVRDVPLVGSLVASVVGGVPMRRRVRDASRNDP